MKKFNITILFLLLSFTSFSLAGELKRIDLLSKADSLTEKNKVCESAMYFFAFKEINSSIKELQENDKLVKQINMHIQKCLIRDQKKLEKEVNKTKIELIKTKSLK